MAEAAEPRRRDDPAEVHLAEPDYAFGAGMLHLRIEQVDRAHPHTHLGDIWYRVEGVQLSATGAELGHREALVRGRRLPPGC